uniref:Uncharacterized protein n=1 Tax=Ditylenchus dipsaci TaxID=166011 RepID=A0A915D3D7_9BILA
MQTSYGYNERSRFSPSQKKRYQHDFSPKSQTGWEQQQEKVPENQSFFQSGGAEPTDMFSKQEAYRSALRSKNQNFNPRSNHENADVHNNHGYSENSRFSFSQQDPHQNLQNQHSQQTTVADMNREVQTCDLPGSSTNVKSELRRFSAYSHVNNFSSVLYSQRLEDGKVQLCIRISSDTRQFLLGQHEQGLREFETKFDNHANLHVLDVGTREMIFTMISDPKCFEKYFTELLPVLVEEQDGRRYGKDDSSAIFFTLELLVNQNHMACIIGRLKAKDINMQKIRYHNKQFPATNEKILVLELSIEKLAEAVRHVVDAINYHGDFEENAPSNANVSPNRGRKRDNNSGWLF